MSKTTKFLRATPVISVAAKADDGTANIIPFYAVDAYDGAKSKRLYVNYTFGKKDNSKQGYTLDSELGKVKTILFDALSGTGIRVIFVSEVQDADRLVEAIQSFLHNLPAESMALLIIDKSVADDVPFFRALNIRQKGSEEVTAGDKILNLNDIGMTINEPFFAVDLKTGEPL